MKREGGEPARLADTPVGAGEGFATQSILHALRRVMEEKLTGFLAIPFKSVSVVLFCSEGKLVTVDKSTASMFYIPLLEAGIEGFAPPPVLPGQGFPLLPYKAVEPLATRFLSGFINRLFEPGAGETYQFRPSKDAPPGNVAPMEIAPFVCRFLGGGLHASALKSMRWEYDRRICLGPGLMTRMAAVPLTPQQAYMLTRLHSGVTLREFCQSSGFPEEQTLRAILIFSFFGLTKKEDGSDPSAFSLAALALRRKQDAPENAPDPRHQLARVEAAEPVPARPPEAPVQPVAPEVAAAGGDQSDQSGETLVQKAKEAFNKGKEAYRAKRLQEACDRFQEAVRTAPHIPECQFMLGKVLALNPSTWKEAEERLLKAEGMRPDQAEFVLELARFYDKVNLKQRAKKYWERVLELDPKNREAMGSLGVEAKKPLNVKDLLNLDLKTLFKSGKDGA